MISIDQAVKIIKTHAKTTTRTLEKSISESLGWYLSENIVSPIDMPPFRQSAMDGYAIHVHSSNQYSVVGEVKAGDPSDPILKEGEAVRIFTGARVPSSANAIAIQEKVIVQSNKILIHDEIKLQANIRPKGEQVLKGATALNKGTYLNAAAIGFVASLGIETINVYAKPSISIVVTGNELIAAGQPLDDGKIYESNGVMLVSALQQLGYHDVVLEKVGDNFDETLTLLKKVMDQGDLVIISGGISVGDYDYVAHALERLNVLELFYKVHQKPGKPLYFGKKKDTLIFALPGNPAATLTCFYLYVLLALEIRSGNTLFELTRIKARSQSIFNNKFGRPQFLKAVYKQNMVRILEGQNSSMLQTFALSNALVFIPETLENIGVNDEVEVIMLP